MVTKLLSEFDDWLHLVVIMVAEFYMKDMIGQMVTKQYMFVAVIIILGAKETEGKFHAVLSFFARRHKSGDVLAHPFDAARER